MTQIINKVTEFLFYLQVLNWNDKLYEKSCPFKKKDIRTFGYPTFNFWLQFRTETNKSSKVIAKQLTVAKQTPLAEDKDNVKVAKVKTLL
jgi:hypothetical protein